MPNPHLRFPVLRRLIVSDYGLFPGADGEGVDHTFEEGVNVSVGINGIPVRSGPTGDVEDEIRRLSGCGRQYDFHLLVTSLLFFLEEKTPVVWEPEAQIEAFRILFLDTQAAPELARLGTAIQQEDS